MTTILHLWHRTFSFFPIMLFPVAVFAQSSDADLNADWHLEGNDKITEPVGANVKEAWRLLKGMVPAEIVTVAVLDGGTDTGHDDLEGAIWLNLSEEPFNGIDDDGNGYIDDGIGWNFLTDTAGNVLYDARYEAIWALALADSLDSLGMPLPTWLDEKALNRCEIQRDELLAIHDENLELGYFAYVWNEDYVETKGRELRALEELVFWKNELGIPKKELRFIKSLLKYDWCYQDLEDAGEEWMDWTDMQLNPSFSPRDPNEPESGYGSRYCASSNSDHGTHVSGIIAADRDNGIGIDGVASGACSIMTVRVVPDGDELDKDVANGIRYAVDNGAKVINMSFGKVVSPEVKRVRAALRYAADNDVLLVHAAGNDAFDTDVYRSYPNPGEDDVVEACFISVGATSYETGSNLLADFSNYGESSVDLFAPGDEILSLAHHGDTVWMAGTSMAAPVVAGVATLLRSYFPELTAPQVKEILMETVHQPTGVFQIPGGSASDKAPFSRFCRSGGIVDAFEAVKRALARSQK